MEVIKAWLPDVDAKACLLIGWAVSCDHLALSLKLGIFPLINIDDYWFTQLISLQNEYLQDMKTMNA